jgi:hypothetical protein
VKTLVLAFFLLAGGCPPSPGPDSGPPAPPPRDALLQDAPTGACATACVNLASAGCPEGVFSDCAARLSAIETLRTQPNPAQGNRPIQCSDFAGVTSTAQARAQGIACDASKTGVPH